MKIKKSLLFFIITSSFVLACNANNGTSTSKTGGDISNNGNSQSSVVSGNSQNQTPQWETIIYTEFKALYDARPTCPWNHLEYKYGDENEFGGHRTENDVELTLYNGVEDLVNGQWVVDTSKTQAGMGDVTPNIIPTDQSIEQFANPPTGYVVEYKKLGTEVVQMHVEFTNGTNQNEIDAKYDKYFYATEFVQKSNGLEVVRCEATWSTK